jgi:hypothetical protein
MINKVEAQGFVYQRKGKDINWVVFAKRMIQDQLKIIQSSKVTRIGNKFGNFNDDEIIVDLEAKEDNTSIEDDAMPLLFSHGYLSLDNKLKQLENYKYVYALEKVLPSIEVEITSLTGANKIQ